MAAVTASASECAVAVAGPEGVWDVRRNNCLGFPRPFSWRGVVGELGGCGGLPAAISSLCSFSFANLSSTFFRAESVSTGLAAPNGFDFDFDSSGAEGEGRGSWGCSLRGKRVNFFRCNTGDPREGEVGGGVSINFVSSHV